MSSTALEAFFVCTGPAPTGDPVLASSTVTAAVAAATYSNTATSSLTSSMPLPSLPMLAVRFGGEVARLLEEVAPGSAEEGKVEKASEAMGDLKSNARSRLVKVPVARSNMDTWRKYGYVGFFVRELTGCRVDVKDTVCKSDCGCR